MLHSPALELPDGVRMDVARYTTPREATPFPSGASAIELAGCATALRTRFIVCTLRHGEEETAWIASADLPALGDERDRELVARSSDSASSLPTFSPCVRTKVIPGTVEGNPDNPANQPPQHGNSAIVDSVHLEGLLRQLVADPDAFKEMDRVVLRYGELIQKGQLSDEEVNLLRRFLEAWAAIREAFHQ